MSRMWAPDATFEFAGEASLVSRLPGSTGPEDSEPAIEALMRFITLSDVERVQSVVDGNRAATVSRVTVSFAGRDPYRTLIFDLWEFTDDGRIRSLLQFTDTARVAHEMRAMGAGDRNLRSVE
jgi:ketosteroid isomerase-like protein